MPIRQKSKPAIDAGSRGFSGCSVGYGKGYFKGGRRGRTYLCGGGWGGDTLPGLRLSLFIFHFHEILPLAFLPRDGLLRMAAAAEWHECAAMCGGGVGYDPSPPHPANGCRPHRRRCACPANGDALRYGHASARSAFACRAAKWPSSTKHRCPAHPRRPSRCTCSILGHGAHVYICCDRRQGPLYARRRAPHVAAGHRL